MSAAAFALRDGRRVEIPYLRCVGWMRVYSGEPLHPDAYELIPRRVLPPDVDVAYFAVTYFANSFPPIFYNTFDMTMPNESQMNVPVPIRDEPFFALDAAGHFTPITNGQAVEWLLQLYPLRYANRGAVRTYPGAIVAAGRCRRALRRLHLLHLAAGVGAT